MRFLLSGWIRYGSGFLSNLYPDLSGSVNMDPGPKLCLYPVWMYEYIYSVFKACLCQCQWHGISIEYPWLLACWWILSKFGRVSLNRAETRVFKGRHHQIFVIWLLRTPVVRIWSYFLFGASIVPRHLYQMVTQNRCARMKENRPSRKKIIRLFSF